ncbi:MAG: MBL fold metallo-hydrolase [Gammaproteobacteria bacterium]|jgi:hypothetical protein|nr:MBL fold metallo-hydrolase [Gammaproteobacteria bacterium]MBT4462979.1 MBL fold metallo-hydrolase [Gammaproteobacteria bacterium]MBT4654598.1 MBL fold metallo-hydrolase [Gammaproteobacteria bacterium]MBT5117091.1 MBL fold metallo-hydrolase [Gammaproteobacteria bacterium]MBT5761284.1 MBL fold metallo-hydrolase [Gammaproteobacteria bacterium]
MRVLFQNHSSLLIQVGERYLLTDPWFNQPAFGSWLPTFAPYIHPTYLAALGDKLNILISHGHDDHFDDRLLKIFDKNTKVITASYKAPSVVNRLKNLGFENVTTVGEEEKEIDGLLISSYIVEEFSHDDSAFLIRNSDGAIIHANDNWHIFEKEHEKILCERTKQYPKEAVLMFSQTNSASGYPLNYKNFSDAEKTKILRSKVAKMVEGGLRNAEKLGLQRMFSYAGFATAYVKNKNYERVGLFPTAKFLKDLLADEGIESSAEIVDLYPGDSINLPDGSITQAFIKNYNDEKIKQVTDAFYQTYENINECISFCKLDVPPSTLNEWVDDFLDAFNEFVERRVKGPDSHFTDLLGKTFSLVVSFDGTKSISKSIRFGSGPIDFKNDANKICYVSGESLFSILKGESLFENLYTGYNAEWERNPQDVYNRDIIMMVVMFSYVYKHRLSKALKEKYSSSET